MKTLKLASFILSFFLLTACSSKVTLPISSSVPAADIIVTKKQDKNNNYLIEVTATNMAEASRLNPPKNNYSVWIITDDGMTKNIGQLSNKNAKKAVLKTVTPFNAKEIFITAEEEGNLNYPAGTEITRSKF
ncbi:putative periplasmic lipoprotein [Flavobacterium lacus]|uniref:Anti-sigma-K factor rskA n=1 Tax=Flavobacterium lacus TaxID=1353778 RepID=A0A328WQP6_9FLAO|nr:hypothetical protein [Flavobacterium lacus]RAR46697.1 hypothetical protein B0I10_1153 [Flavobacterium lacus]